MKGEVSYRYAGADNAVPCLLDKDLFCGSGLTRRAGSSGKSSDDRSASPFVEDADGYKIGFGVEGYGAGDIWSVTKFG